MNEMNKKKAVDKMKDIKKMHATNAINEMN